MELVGRGGATRMVVAGIVIWMGGWMVDCMNGTEGHTNMHAGMKTKLVAGLTYTYD